MRTQSKWITSSYIPAYIPMNSPPPLRARELESSRHHQWIHIFLRVSSRKLILDQKNLSPAVIPMNGCTIYWVRVVKHKGKKRGKNKFQRQSVVEQKRNHWIGYEQKL